MIASIAFTVYPVSNMERARAFYEHVLGLHASYHYQGVWVEYDLGGSTFAITTMKIGHTPGAKGAVVAFEVSDFDAFVQKMKERAVSFSSRKRSTRLSAAWRSSRTRTGITSRSTNDTRKSGAAYFTLIFLTCPSTFIVVPKALHLACIVLSRNSTSWSFASRTYKSSMHTGWRTIRAMRPRSSSKINKKERSLRSAESTA